jgi:hypothetical protein
LCDDNKSNQINQATTTYFKSFKVAFFDISVFLVVLFKGKVRKYKWFKRLLLTKVEERFTIDRLKKQQLYLKVHLNRIVLEF